MSHLKKIIIAVSGGIAAYKIPQLIRLFKKNNTQVKVVVTKNALHFVTELTLQTLSENAVYSDMFDNNEEFATGHISISDWADAMIVAPATANILAKFAGGIADDALSTVYLSFNKPVYVAPAMNTKMWDHPATQENLEILKQRGVHFIEPDAGFLACGYDGKGRMAEPEEIFNKIILDFNENLPLEGKKVLISAGPTFEPIDPVRFIGNRSSGKMGYALADVFAELGATVTLISGPVSIITNHPKIQLVKVETAQQMAESCMDKFPDSNIVIMAAAVADFTPEKIAANKIKKSESKMTLNLMPTTDILALMGTQKKKNQILVGFALETDNEESNALIKLRNKNLDCIVLNSLQNKGSGFGGDTNQITIFDKKGKSEFECKPKNLVARDIADFIVKNFIR